MRTEKVSGTWLDLYTCTRFDMFNTCIRKGSLQERVGMWQFIPTLHHVPVSSVYQYTYRTRACSDN